MPQLLSLAPEIWDKILDRIESSALKRLRRVCKPLSHRAAIHLFRAIPFEFAYHGSDSLINVASHPVLSRYVRTLLLRSTAGLPELPNFYVWKQSGHTPTRVDQPSVLYHQNKLPNLDHSKLVALHGWVALTMDNKMALYQHYERDRTAAEEKLRYVIKSVCVRVEDHVRCGFDPQSGTDGQEVADAIAQRLVAAIRRLPNITHFVCKRNTILKNHQIFQWRHLRFRRAAVLSHTTTGINEGTGSIQLIAAFNALSRLCAPRLDHRSVQVLVE